MKSQKRMVIPNSSGHYDTAEDCKCYFMVDHQLGLLFRCFIGSSQDLRMHGFRITIHNYYSPWLKLYFVCDDLDLTTL